MDDKMLRAVQLAQLEILKEFKRVCEKNSIPYILVDGTLLGAVRHKGFIPWDDDIDVGMTREGYEQFLKHSGDLGEGYYIQTWHNDPEIGVPFGKLRKKNTVYRELLAKNMTNNGIYIDIFPCDKFIPHNPENDKFFKKLNKLITAVLLKSKVYEGPRKNLLVRCSLTVLTFPYVFSSKKRLIEKYETLVRRYNDKADATKYFENGSASEIGRYVADKKCFEEIENMPFEDDEFSGPANYDEYLKGLYGDYMQLPPENERGDRHQVLEVKL